MIHFLEKHKSIRVLRSSIRRASKIKRRKEGVEALNSWRIATARKIANIWGKQDEFYTAFGQVRIGLLITPEGIPIESDQDLIEYYDDLDNACDVVQKCIRDLEENGHPRYNTQPSQLWTTVTTTVVSVVLGAVIGAFLRPSVDRLIGNSEAVGQDPRQIKVDLDNALKRFDFEYSNTYDSVKGQIYHRFSSQPGRIQMRLKEHHERNLLKRNTMIDSFLTAYSIAGGDTTGMVPLRRLSRSLLVRPPSRR